MNEIVKKENRGRPTKYKEEFAGQAFGLAKLGAKDTDLADFFKVNVDTIQEWKKVHKIFSDLIKSGKEEFDNELVESSLRKRATGMTRTVERVGKDGEVVACVEELPPDPTSMIFWLKNRRPDRWRDKQEHELSGTIGVTPVLNYGIKDK